ncbi:hypothetical protein SMICM304S_00986 [Streptomyces microflavus]
MHIRGDHAELVVGGRLDVRSAADARTVLHSAVDDGVGDLVLDLTELNSWDATGLGVIMGAHRRAGRAAPASCCAVSRRRCSASWWPPGCTASWRSRAGSPPNRCRASEPGRTRTESFRRRASDSGRTAPSGRRRAILTGM